MDRNAIWKYSGSSQILDTKYSNLIKKLMFILSFVMLKSFCSKNVLFSVKKLRHICCLSVWLESAYCVLWSYEM